MIGRQFGGTCFSFWLGHEQVLKSRQHQSKYQNIKLLRHLSRPAPTKLHKVLCGTKHSKETVVTCKKIKKATLRNMDAKSRHEPSGTSNTLELGFYFSRNCLRLWAPRSPHRSLLLMPFWSHLPWLGLDLPWTFPRLFGEASSEFAPPEAFWHLSTLGLRKPPKSQSWVRGRKRFPRGNPNATTR